MKKYIISETTKELAHAGTKATEDILRFAKMRHYSPAFVRMDTDQEGKIGKLKRQIGFFRDWGRAVRFIKGDSLLILQHPFHYPQLTRNICLKSIKKKGVKVIGIIHDVEELRAFRYNDYYKKEFDFMIKYDDILIVHNEKMKDYFVSIGFPAERLVVLEIFDYYYGEMEREHATFERKITIAGNLDTTKCGYVGEITRLKNVGVDLYGPNFDEKLLEYSNIKYNGIVPPAELPSKLKAGFGLVWDGSSIDGCQGQSGQYLKYNNPHKLSLYIASGLPVVIWKCAAESTFVREHNVGICVDSLTELDDILAKMTKEEYNQMAENAYKLGQKLGSGYYTREALKKAEMIAKEI